MTRRPTFQRGNGGSQPDSAEALFAQLQRDKSHNFLRGEQQDILRSYHAARDASDIALELPTGTGKTAVGLLIAEWRRRRSNRPAAFLSLTNQLANQAMSEAGRLGIPFADLVGDRGERDQAEVGRFRFGQAVGISTYANLFNINPVIRDTGLLVLDDAHGAEQRVVDMWTVRISANADQQLYEQIVRTLRPVLTPNQLQTLSDPNSQISVQLAEIQAVQGQHERLTGFLDASTSARIRFTWPLVRNNLGACIVLLSPYEVVIRPIIPPTHTHSPFAGASQRIYMSATLGGSSDLERAFGLRRVEIVRAQHPQWGKRYIIAPEAAASEDAAWEVVGKVWDRLNPRRATILAPSQRHLQVALSRFEAVATRRPTVLDASDITDSLDVFTEADSTVLGVAGRYDGLDLPDDACRLLIMYESPRALGEFERYMREHWKAGPLLMRMERVRLVQGLGRCTRNPTDYAIVFWLGQSLIDVAADAKMLGGLPSEISTEIKWGAATSLQAGIDPNQLVEMAMGLLQDPDYRTQANESISETYAPASSTDAPDGTGSLEVRFAAQLWDDDIQGAYQTARDIADALGEPQLSGLRAWWWYLASCMANRLGNLPGEDDCLRRANACVVNRGWLGHVMRMRSRAVLPEEEARVPPNTENVWDGITSFGLAGLRFNNRMTEMSEFLRSVNHRQFHEGLEIVGRLLGAVVTRRDEAGTPDVVWTFPGDIHVAFEAKTEMDPGGDLSKRAVQQAAGHVNWVRSELSADARVIPVIVGPSSSLAAEARPHAQGVYYFSPTDAQNLAATAQAFAMAARTTYAGREFPEIHDELGRDLEAAGLSLDKVQQLLTRTPLLND